ARNGQVHGQRVEVDLHGPDIVLNRLIAVVFKGEANNRRRLHTETAAALSSRTQPPPAQSPAATERCPQPQPLPKHVHAPPLLSPNKCLQLLGLAIFFSGKATSPQAQTKEGITGSHYA